MLNIQSLDLYILYFLNEKEILNMNRTSKYFNKLVNKNCLKIIKFLLKRKYNVKMFKYNNSISLLRNNKNLSTKFPINNIRKIMRYL